ncbi:MAG: hypothetical protein M3253_03300 [Chloroflexota bacterium]|nr:hypothetical protein [Chloroflexota bacterium]
MAEPRQVDGGRRMEQVTISRGLIEIVILPAAGARLHRLRAFGNDVLRTPGDPAEHLADPFYWGAYVMAPWCNRLDSEPLNVGGKVVDLQPNFRDGTAIHGQVYLRPWEQEGDGEFAVRAGGDGWPWPYRVALGIAIDERAVRLQHSLQNLADEPMPAGMGIHPWFAKPIQLAVAADRVYRNNQATTAAPEAVEGAFDLRRMGAMADDLDATWADVGDPPVQLWWPQRGLQAVMRAQSPSLHIVAASPNDIEAIAVEPETHAPQGLRRLLNGEPGALQWLSPGETLRLDVVLSFEHDEPEGG